MVREEAATSRHVKARGTRSEALLAPRRIQALVGLRSLGPPQASVHETSQGLDKAVRPCRLAAAGHETIASFATLACAAGHGGRLCRKDASICYAGRWG